MAAAGDVAFLPSIGAAKCPRSGGAYRARAVLEPLSLAVVRAGNDTAKERNMEQQKKSYKVVYTIVERRRDGKKFWLRIGAAFTNQDGSLNVHLDATPVNGQLQIRDYQPYEERARTQRSDAADDLASALAG